ncbi:MAG TPA: hypothetical protein VKE93_00495 [Candidatus Angelobacter sp.]|nr:hypothetical protein [Candidatus Angelobacter sp.]
MSNLRTENPVKGYDHNDPSLKTGEGGLTVWDLQKMAQEKQYGELDKLFNNGLTMNALPVGLAAGAAARVLDVDTKPIAEALDSLTGKNWRGKVFFSSDNKRVSQGRNRIKAHLLIPRSPIVPMAKFVTKLLDSHPLAPQAKSNLVILNYADLQTRPYWQETLLTKVPVYDVQVAVKGKYGPVFIGKTWLGKYDNRGEFTASNPDKLIAWYFIDFNEGALKEQRDSHWDGSEEELLDPLPHIDNLASEAA